MESTYLWSFGERLNEQQKGKCGVRQKKRAKEKEGKSQFMVRSWSVPKRKERTARNQYIYIRSISI